LELLETIRLETARLSRLVENVLDLSRIQAGAAAPRPALWAVDDLLGQAAAEASEPTRLHIDVPAGLPAARVDAVQLQRVLVNLIENALKFGAGEVDLTARAAGDELVVDVLDRGQGARARQGLGLGLAIAHGFTDANGGTLTLEPREGGGMRARLTLPAQPVPAELAT
jgi:two-component system sensor histidine kinase KdpD